MNNEFSIVCSGLFGSMKVLARVDTYNSAQLVHKQIRGCELVQTQFGNTTEAIEESIVFKESKLKARKEKFYEFCVSSVVLCLIGFLVWRWLDRSFR